jgi:hypothetical protein
MEAQPDVVSDDYQPDPAWQRALEEKRRLQARMARSN